MKVLATCTKTTDGRKSTWRFCEVDGKFFALRDNNKIVSCKNLEDLRRLYKVYINNPKYGFTAVIG